jgi:hypothetical protein
LGRKFSKRQKIDFYDFPEYLALWARIYPIQAISLLFIKRIENHAGVVSVLKEALGQVEKDKSAVVDLKFQLLIIIVILMTQASFGMD